MWLKRSLRSSSAILSIFAMLQAQAAMAQTQGVHQQPLSSALTATYATVLGLEPQLTASQRLALIRQKVKYVFVLFQENRSFEQFFGTFPGADGLYYPKNAKAGVPQQMLVATTATGWAGPVLDRSGRVGRWLAA